MMIEGLVLIIAGIAIMAWGFLTWRAWKLEKPMPVFFFNKQQERTEMSGIAMGFEVFLDFLAALICILIGYNFITQ